MSVQFLPEYFTARRPSKSEQLWQQLEPIGKALGGTLQATIQGYYDQKKENKKTAAAEALSSLPQYKSIPGIKELLSGTEQQHWEPLLKQVRASTLSGMNLGGDVSNLIKAASGGNVGLGANINQAAPVSQATPPPPEQERPTPATTAANLSAMQRAGNIAPYTPGSPEAMAAQGMGPEEVQQPHETMQRARQEEEAPKPLLLGDLDEGTYQKWRATQANDVAEEADKIRKGQIATKANLAKIENKNINQKRFEEDVMRDRRDYDFKIQESKSKNKKEIIANAQEATKDFRSAMHEKEASLAPRKQSIEVTRDAILRGNVEPFSAGHIASIFGLPEVAGQDAAQMMSGVKTLVVHNLSPISGKQNVYLEQMMAGSYPQIGRTKEGNLIAIDSADGLYKIDEAYVEAFNQVYDKYMNDPHYGYFPEKGEREVNNAVKSKLKNIRDSMFLQLQDDREINIPEEQMTKMEKQFMPTPLTNKRAKGIMTKAEKDLSKALNRDPTKEEVIGYYEQLVEKNNYFKVKQ